MLGFLKSILATALMIWWLPNATLAQVNEPNSTLRPISFLIAPDVYQEYLGFLDGRTVKEVTSIIGPLRRDPLEVFTTIYLLKLAGLNFEPEFIVSASLQRHLVLLQSGSVAMSSALIEEKDLQGYSNIATAPSPFPKRPILGGLYTAQNNVSALSVTTAEQIKALTAVSNRSWGSNWQAISSLGFSRLVAVSDWAAMCRVVLANRVDLLLAPINANTPDQMKTSFGLLSRIKPFAIQLDVARVFAVSSNHPDSKIILSALTSIQEQPEKYQFIVEAMAERYPQQNLDLPVTILK